MSRSLPLAPLRFVPYRQFHSIEENFLRVLFKIFLACPLPAAIFCFFPGYLTHNVLT
jgi:hypothetical protein